MKIRAMAILFLATTLLTWMLVGVLGAGGVAADEERALVAEEQRGGLADPTSTLTHTVYLPATTNNFCHDGMRDFFDDFSDPNSGWFVGEDDFVRAEYVGGEYRVLTKNDDYFYLFGAPTCPRQNYVVEVDARWVGQPGSSYGLMFGMQNGFDRYYLFEVNTDYQMYGLWRRDAQGWTTIAPVAGSGAIRGGTASNHLRVFRNGYGITLEVNGTTLGTWHDSGIYGMSEVGMVIAPYDDAPFADARFDNFKVTLLASQAVAETEPDTAATEGSQGGTQLGGPLDRDKEPYHSYEASQEAHD